MKEDVNIISKKLADDFKRKKKLEEEVDGVTLKFKGEAVQIKKELEEAKRKLRKVFKHKEIVEDQGEFLIHDRGSNGAV